jgi:O-methyltransferase involved in polyketide biosynthesis
MAVEPAMSSIQSVALESVQKTLLLPLWGRAVESKKPQPLLVDPLAVEIAAQLNFDFDAMTRDLTAVTRLSWIFRSLHMDRTAREFLARHVDGAIVNLGCGLDTSFERLDNGRLLWFDVDLPDVISLRRRLLPEHSRHRTIAESIVSEAWQREIEPRGAVLFLAAGVLYYLAEAQVKGLFSSLATTFPGAEMVFDACSPLGGRIANRRVIAAAGIDPSAALQWGLRSARELERWDARIAVVEAYPIFRGARRRGLALGERIGTLISDALNLMSIVHLKFASGLSPKLPPLKSCKR